NRMFFHGYTAVRWEFFVRQQERLLRKVDVFFEDHAGNAIAILTQAPARDYSIWDPLFKRTRASLQLRAKAPAPPQVQAPLRLVTVPRLPTPAALVPPRVIVPAPLPTVASPPPAIIIPPS